MSNLLDSPVLVLNRFYMAIDVTTARRALVLLYIGHCEVVQVTGGQYETFDFDHWRSSATRSDRSIRTVAFRIGIPFIIRLTVCDRLPVRQVPLTRKNVLVRDEYICQYCGKKLPPSRLSLDHVFPVCRGGRQSWTNVVCACFDCNSRKGGRMPKEAGMKLIRKPRTPDFAQAIWSKLPEDRVDIWKRFF